ncbi:MAG: hypothetical protein SFY69_03965 [Planctomycetota bacterium]|nr:hypothetical protein [Planctomycetota bacterium]
MTTFIGWESRARTACAIGALSLAASAGLAQTTWKKNIPDAFQHQRWGAKPGPNPGGLPAIAGAADAGGDQVELVGAAPRQFIFSWQVSYLENPPGPGGFPAPNAGRVSALATFSGWCNFATYTNQLYHWKERGYNTMGAVNDAADLHTEMRTLVRDAYVDAAANNIEPLNQFTKSVNNILVARGVNPADGPRVRDGLTAQNYKQSGPNVCFQSATGDEKLLPKTTLFQHLQTSMKFGDTVNLRLGYEPPADLAADAPQRDLWWRGPSTREVPDPTPDNPTRTRMVETGAFHSVAVAGFSVAGNGTIHFADPDSNPTGNSNDGNRGADAGWKEAFPQSGNANNDLVTSSDNWLAAAPAAGNANNKVKQRRFAAGANVPVPAGAVPAAAERTKLYFEGTLNANKTELAIAGADFKRYDTVKIRYIETIEAVKGGKKPRTPGAGPEPTTFQVSPAIDADAAPTQDGTPIAMGEINEVYLFPAFETDRLLEVSNIRVNGTAESSVVVTDLNMSVPNAWNIYFFAPGALDPFGNELPEGGVKIWAGDGIENLAGLDLMEFDYQTATGGELGAWDFMYNDADVAEYASFGVQSYGGLSGFDLPMFQIPAPGAAGLLGLAALAWGRRRRA